MYRCLWLQNLQLTKTVKFSCNHGMIILIKKKQEITVNKFEHIRIFKMASTSLLHIYITLISIIYRWIHVHLSALETFEFQI